MKREEVEKHKTLNFLRGKTGRGKRGRGKRGRGQ